MISRVFLLFVALAGLAVFSFAHAQSSGCLNYYTSSTPIPAGYGAAYDIFNSAKELLVNVDCSGVSPFLKVGSGAANQYVYSKGYIYSGSVWQPITLTSTAALVSNAWYPAAASSNLTGGIPSAWTYAVGYVCTWSGSAWQCGCADTTCATPAWQLQAFISSAVANGGGSSSGGANGSGAGGAWAGSPNASAIVISPSGSDGNPCTAASPCQSLEKAQQMARSGSTKLIYLRAGTYNRSGTLTLDGNDNGETWMTYPGDAVDSAIIDGGNSVAYIFEEGANNATFNGLTIQHFVDDAIHHDPGQGQPTIQNVTVENCDVGFNTQTGSWGAVGIEFENINGVTITNNYVHDLQSQGIGVFAYWQGSVLENVNISNNVVLRAVQGMTDGGGIYVSHHGGYLMNNGKITNNYVRDYGASGSSRATGIYMDDSASHWVVTGNIVGPPNPSCPTGSQSCYAFEENNGSYNHVEDNIIDLGSTGNVANVFWYYGDNPQTNITGPNQTGETFKNNIIISNFSGNQFITEWGAAVAFMQASGGAGDYAIGSNMYHNYGGGQELTNGEKANDGSPVHADPQLSGWTYQLAAGSPAYTQINFPHIVGGWGPPGFVIPQTGTPPSSPH